MPVYVSLILSLLLAGGLLTAGFLGIQFFFASRASRGLPTLQIFGAGPGKMAALVKWSSTAHRIQFYRLMITYASPESTNKEGRVTYTFPQVQKKSFYQIVTLPERVVQLLSRSRQGNAVVTVSVKTVEEITLEKSFRLSRFSDSLKRHPPKSLGDCTQLPDVEEDRPVVTSLDFEELQVNNDRLAKLAAAAKAKEAAQKTAAAAAAAKATPAAPAAPAT